MMSHMFTDCCALISYHSSLMQKARYKCKWTVLSHLGQLIRANWNYSRAYQCVWIVSLQGLRESFRLLLSHGTFPAAHSRMKTE